MPTAVLDIDLFGPWEDISVSSEYDTAEVLLRWRGTALARTRIKLSCGRLLGVDLWQAAYAMLGESLTSKVLDALISERPPHVQDKSARLACSVIICTRDRVLDLARCLDSLCASKPENAEIIVVDNAPPNEDTAELCAQYPVRYVMEPRKGLNWARAHGAKAAKNEILLYTDDDVVVDPGWIRAMCAPFEDESVGAAAGIIMPRELETEAQEMFEQYGGFQRWFLRRTFNSTNLPPVASGKIGAGASMAVRRRIAIGLGLFEVEMDCGTAALSGGDHYAFYRLLREGYSIVATPDAICWHRHRRTIRELKTTLYGYSVGVYSFLLRCILDHRDFDAFRPGLAWFLSHHLRNFWRGLRGDPEILPWRFTLEEIKGVFAAPKAYWKVKQAERRTKWIFANPLIEVEREPTN